MTNQTQNQKIKLFKKSILELTLLSEKGDTEDNSGKDYFEKAISI